MKQSEFNYQLGRLKSCLERAHGANNVIQSLPDEFNNAKWASEKIMDLMREAIGACLVLSRAEVRDRSLKINN